MPTGYTAKLYEGAEQSFEEFLMACAHNFGALVLLRDEGMDSPIPEFTPNVTYEEKRLTEARAALAEAQGWSDDEAQAAADAAHAERMASWTKQQTERRALKARYEAMLREARAWKPPTADHEGLKKFMVDQLEESIRFDCSDLSQFMPEVPNGVDYKREAIERAVRDIGYSEQHIAEEIERTESRNAWVAALRESVSERR